MLDPINAKRGTPRLRSQWRTEVDAIVNCDGQRCERNQSR